MNSDCWQQRGCDAEMAATCPHAISSEDKRCVAECYYANCDRPQRKHAGNLDILLDPTVDRTTAIKEPCTYCEFFLLNGPRLAAKNSDDHFSKGGLQMAQEAQEVQKARLDF